MKFDFQQSFGCPVKVINDAAMQALVAIRVGACSFLDLARAWVSDDRGWNAGTDGAGTPALQKWENLRRLPWPTRPRTNGEEKMAAARGKVTNKLKMLWKPITWCWAEETAKY